MPLENDPFIALGKAIREFRQSAELTQEELAHRTGITVGQLSKIERGRSNPRFTTVRRIAEGLGVPLPTLASRAESLTDEP